MQDETPCKVGIGMDLRICCLPVESGCSEADGANGHAVSVPVDMYTGENK